MNEPTSAVEQAIAARIARVRAEEARKREERAEFAAARAAGVARRHAAKLRHLAETCEPIRPANSPNPETCQPIRRANNPNPEDPMPAALRPAVCPSCRCERPARLVTTVVVSGALHDVVRCPLAACELMWLVRAERPRTAPAAA